MQRILKCRSGFSIIEITIASAALILVSYFGFGIQKIFDTNTKKMALEKSAAMFQSKLSELFISSNALSNTVAASGVNCLLNPSAVCGSANNTWVPISIYDGTASPGVQITDLAAGTLGFKSDLSPCMNYPSTECPMRYLVFYRHSPGTIAAVTQQIMFRATIEVAPAFQKYFSAERANVFSFEQTLTLTANCESICNSLGGTCIVGATPTCLMPFEGACPPGQAVAGYDNVLDQKICRSIMPINPVNIPAGQILTGFDPDGTARFSTMDSSVQQGPNCTPPQPPGVYCVIPAPADANYGINGVGMFDGPCGGVDGGGSCSQ